MKYPKPGAEVTITIGDRTVLNEAWLNAVSFGGPYITSISVNEGSSSRGYLQLRGVDKMGAQEVNEVFFDSQNNKVREQYERRW